MSEDSSPDAVALILPNTPGFLFCSQQNRIEYLFIGKPTYTEGVLHRHEIYKIIIFWFSIR